MTTLADPPTSDAGEGMGEWRDHLTSEEAARLEELDAQAKAASIERRKIFDRARKRAQRA